MSVTTGNLFLSSMHWYRDQDFGAARREHIMRLRAEGLAWLWIAWRLGLSRQRVKQIYYKAIN